MSDTPPRYGERVDPGVCYRHPTRQSWVLCQRCGRTICPECQIPAAVGVQCPECVREANRDIPRIRRGRRMPAFLRRLRTDSSAPVVTYALIAITVVVWLAQLVTGSLVTGLLWFAGAYVDPTAPVLGVSFEPWRMLTSVFAHSTPAYGGVLFFLHILFNMYVLFAFGPQLEQMLGRARFLALYLIAGFGGSVAVVLLASPTSPVLGASGAVFGMFGAYFVIQRHLGGNTAQILVLIGINLALGFFSGGVSWQAHVGGLLVGALVALIFTRTRNRSQRALQIVALAGLVAALIVITAVRVAIGLPY